MKWVRDTGNYPEWLGVFDAQLAGMRLVLYHEHADAERPEGWTCSIFAEDPQEGEDEFLFNSTRRWRTRTSAEKAVKRAASAVLRRRIRALERMVARLSP